MDEKTLLDDLNKIAHKYLAPLIGVLLFIVATAAGFYWTTQVDLMSMAGANEQRSMGNRQLFLSVDSRLSDIQAGVSETRVDVAVIKEKVESLEEEVKK